MVEKYIWCITQNIFICIVAEAEAAATIRHCVYG